MQLYGSSFSPFVRKVLAFAAEKGIKLHVSAVRPGDPDPAFRACSPFGKIPRLSRRRFRARRFERDRRLSRRDEARAEPDPGRAARAGADDLVRRVRRYDPHRLRRQDVLQPHRRAALLRRPGDEAVAAAAEKDELPPILDHLESVAPESGFLVEDRLTLADIAVASPFVNLGHLGVAPDPARHPKLAAYVGRILARPSFAPWIEKEKAQLAQARPAA